MAQPGFTAEISVYRTSRWYRFASGGGFLHDASAAVVPQDCGWFQEAVCAGFIAEGTLLCAGLCTAGPAACLVCWAGFLGWAYDLCKDCIPSGGGGGGRSDFCCPLGTNCRCGGKCVPGEGCVGGKCLRPNQECP
jgi:hypothetical protein